MSSAVSELAGELAVVFAVEGVPRPQGRKTAITRGRRTVVVESGRALLRPWQDAIAGAAARAVAEPLAGPVRVELDFAMPRPLDHYRGRSRDRGLRDDAATWHSHRPDLDKLSRAVLDALTGPALVDDGQVVELDARKAYAEAAGVTITLAPARSRS